MTIFNSTRVKFKRTSHEYIKWLTFANAGMLQDGNIDSIEYSIKNLPTSNPVLEIGSFCGLSTNVMSFYLEKENKENVLITCDKWMFEGSEKINDYLGGSKITHKQYKEYVKESFIKNINFFSRDRISKISTLEEISDDFFELWKNRKTRTDIFGKNIQMGGNISFAYIDGNHSYDFVKRDFLNVDKYLDLEGFILFDDSSRRAEYGEVNRLIKEVIAKKNYEVIMRNPNYLLKKLR